MKLREWNHQSGGDPTDQFNPFNTKAESYWHCAKWNTALVLLAISPSVRRPISREVKVCQGFTNCCHSRRNLGLEKYASSSSKKRPRDAKENLPSWKNNESSCLHVFYDPKKRNCPLTRSLDKWLSVKIRIACNMLTFIFLNCRIFRLRLGFFFTQAYLLMNAAVHLHLLDTF